MAKSYHTREQALAKLQRFCAYQDRCHQEVRRRLLDLGIYGDTLEEIMSELIAEDFLNEERFARSFVRGKFRFKQWGRRRLLQELQQRQISAYCIRKGMEEIDASEYRATLVALVTRRAAELAAAEPQQRCHKTVQYAIQKGFEPELVWEIWRAHENQADERDTI